MPFESNRAFGRFGGFEPGREYASAAGAMRPEVMGLDVIGEAAQQMRQFPVIAGGGRGLAIPGLSQVEVTGGPSQIGEEGTEDPDGLLGELAGATQLGDELPVAGPAQLALMAAGTGQRAGRFAADVSNLSAFSGAGTPGFAPGSLEGLSEAQMGDVLLGGTVSPGTPTGPSSSALGATSSGAATVGALLQLLSAGGVGGKDLGLAGSALGGVSATTHLADLLRSGNLASLGGAVGGGGALGALLGIIGQQTGNQDLVKAGALLATTASTAGTIGSAVAGTLGAPVGGAAGAALGAAAPAVGAAAGAAGTLAIPLAVVTLLDQFMGPDDGGLIGQALSKTVGNYPKFVPELMRGQGQQGTAFGTLGQALPYVQSKEELGQLLNTYKNYLSTTTGITPEQKGGTFAGDPYSLAAIPGVGPVTHGQATPSVDWGPQTQELQALIDALLPSLPGERLTAADQFLEGEPGMRLWTQFLDRERNAPAYLPANYAGGPLIGNVDEGGQQGVVGQYEPLNKGFYGLEAVTRFPEAQFLTYGQPGYDYAGAGLPEPGQFLGDISPYWLELMGGQGPSNTPGRALVAA